MVVLYEGLNWTGFNSNKVTVKVEIKYNEIIQQQLGKINGKYEKGTLTEIILKLPILFVVDCKWKNILELIIFGPIPKAIWITSVNQLIAQITLMLKMVIVGRVYWRELWQGWIMHISPCITKQK